jgi:copper homeostasis protein
MKKILLEAPVFNLEAALLAESYGVDRIELCSNFITGGETPSAGSLKFLKQQIGIPIFVMIRPRGGDFFYSSAEIQVMKEDIMLMRDLGANGFVFGALTADGHIDEKTNRELVACARGLPCTLHRAFDSTVDLHKSLEVAISCGFRRILTSGGKNDVSTGLETIKNLMDTAGNRIIILPGGGLHPDHLPSLYPTGKLAEIHASCKAWRPSEAIFNRPDLTLTQDTDVLTISQESVLDFALSIQKL